MCDKYEFDEAIYIYKFDLVLIWEYFKINSNQAQPAASKSYDPDWQ